MSIITNFDKFTVNEEDKDLAPAEPSAPAETTPTDLEIKKPSDTETTPTQEPASPESDDAKPSENSDESAEEKTYSFTWYGWVPSYKDFDQEWLEVKAKTDAEAIKKFKESPSAKFTDTAVLDAIDGETPTGATTKFEDQEDGSKVFKSVEIDMETDKFVLKVTKYPANYFADPSNNKKEISKEEIPPFFGEAAEKTDEKPANPESSGTEQPKQEQPMPEPAKESIVLDETGDLESLFDLACEELRNSGISCRASLTKDDVLIELGRNYPDDLGGAVFNILEKCGISPNRFSVCAESHGHKSEKIVHINGGPKDWSMLRRYGRRHY